MAQASEFFHVNIANVDGAEGCGERIGVELRIVARFRNGANVDQLCDGVGLQQFEEVLDWMRGMADGEDGQHFLGGHHSIGFDAEGSLAALGGPPVEAVRMRRPRREHPPRRVQQAHMLR